jgi:hypothetical protein
MSSVNELPRTPGYAIATLDEMGDGYGFRKIRRALGITAFGINALVGRDGRTVNGPSDGPPGAA